MKGDINFLSSFLPKYPSVDDPDFRQKIFEKKEFNILKLGVTEETPDEPGKLFQIQKFVQRYINPNTGYDRALIHADPGVGKSCMMSAIIENFKDIIVNGIKRRPALIVVPNDKLAHNMMREISRVCTNNLYKAALTARHVKKGIAALTENMAKRQFRKIFDGSYKIVTHEKFFLSKKSNYKDYEFYSNRIICIDEVHKIREYSLKEGKESLYQEVYEFLHGIKNTRQLLFTGTFIWDSADEVSSTMNLILPEDEQLPIEKFDKIFFTKGKDGKEVLTEKGKDYLKSISKYYVRIRAMEADVPKTEIGVKGDKTFIEHFKVYPSVLSEQHSKILKEVEKTSNEENEGKENFSQHKLAYFTTLFFPRFDDKGKIIGYYKNPKDGYREYINNQSYTIKDTFFLKLVLHNLSLISAKLAAMFDVLEKKEKEKAVIYQEYVSVVGTTLTAAIFRAKGYEVVTSDSDLENIMKSKKKRIILIAGKNSYVHEGKEIRSGSTVENVVRASEIFNDPKNLYGEYCRGILGSKMIILGYSFKDVRQFHIIENHWNDPLMEQALSRGYRAGSFDNLPKGERYYHIFRYFSVHPADEKGPNFKPSKEDRMFPKTEPFSLRRTRDFRIYEVVQEKSYRRALILRVMEAGSFTCALTYERNVLSSDIDFSKQCNYDRCNYECDGINPYTKDTKVWQYRVREKDLDYSGYISYYADEEVAEISQKIKSFILKNTSVDFEYLIKNLKHHPLLIYETVSRMVESRAVVRDSLGKRYYMIYSDGKISLSENISSKDISSSYYSQDRTFVKRTSLEKIVDDLLIENDRLNTNLCNIIRGEEDILNVSVPTRNIIAEWVYENKKIDSESRDYVIEPLKDYFHEMKDGTLLNMLYLRDVGGSYNVMKKLIKGQGRFRVFEDGQWRFLRETDREVLYEKELKEKEPKMDFVSFGSVIGIYSSKDDSFRIKSGSNPKGRKCHTLKIQDIAQIFIEMGFPSVPSDKFKDQSKKEIMDLLKAVLKDDYDFEKYSKSQLVNLASFLMLGNIKRDICPALKELFVENRKLNYI